MFAEPKPIIGMPVQRRVRNAVFHQDPSYSWSVEFAGGVPLLIPLVDDVLPLLQLCDGFIITGSYADVNPSLYGAIPPADNYSDVMRDRVDFSILAHAESTGKPVFGICRGCQIMNVYRGGSLALHYSDIADTKVDHNLEPEDFEVHHVNLAEGSVVSQTSRRIRLAVNSLHRQVCKDVAATLAVTGVSEDGLIEAIEDKRDPARFFGVQWHPEILATAGDPTSRALFDGFIETAKRSRAARRDRVSAL
jgi:putative glutamine amidotransferase